MLFRSCGQIFPRRAVHRHPQFSRPKSTSSSSPPPSAPPPETSSAKTIPGPAWLWLEPIATPFRAYGRVQRRRPYVTQFISALVIYFCGDLSAQSISVGNPNANKTSSEGEVIAPKKEYDPYRTARALFIGGLSSIPSYRWFLWLGNSFNYASKTLSLSTKVVVNQIVFTPIFNSYFFGMQSLLTGATFAEVVERIRHTVPVSWVNSCKLWPAVTAFTFAFIPEHYRSIFAGVIAIGWQTYLSVLNQRAALQEQAAHEHVDQVDASVESAAKEHTGRATA